MKIIYANISPITNAYTNIQHLFYLKDQKPQKVYLCVWDNFVLESPIMGEVSDESKNERLLDNVRVLEKIMEHLEIDYRTIYLSEMWSRAFRNPEISKIYQNILSKINLDGLKEGFNMNYIPFGDINLSKVTYILVDYLIATYLPEIAPEICNSQPNHYLTSEQFRVFQKEIDHIIKKNSRYDPPKNIFVTKIPVILHKTKRIIPSMEMSEDSIRNIVKSHYDGEMPDNKEIYEMCDILFCVLGELTDGENRFERDSSELERFVGELNNENLIDFISRNMYDYFTKINGIVSKISLKESKKSIYVADYNEFSKNVKTINKIKLNILRYCDGTNTSLDISKKTGLKLTTVSTYLTRLKKRGLLNLNKKPKRLVDNIVINLDSISD